MYRSVENLSIYVLSGKFHLYLQQNWNLEHKTLNKNMGFLKEFKEFAMRGNLIDMAVGVVIGGAFGKIVSSIVADIMMPIISILTGGLNFTQWKYVIKQAVMDGDKVVTPEVTINYGTFIQVTLDFLIVALSVFLVIKIINQIRRKKEEQPAAPDENIVLLTEIRDLLKDGKQ